MSNESSGDEEYEAWEPENLEETCALLRRNDPSLKTVHFGIGNSEYAADICSALQDNTVVEYLHLDFRYVPPQVHGTLNRYVLFSPSLQELVFDTANGSESLDRFNRLGLNDRNPLPFANLLLSAVGGNAPIVTLKDVPLCQSTALSFTNALIINNDKLQHVSIDFPFEEPSDEEEGVETLIQQSLAPEVARALGQSNLVSLSLNWLEHELFSTGEAFFPSLPGCLPLSLRQLELSNFVDSDLVATAIADMIEQSGCNLDSILLSFCMFEDDNFHRILGALQRAKPYLKVLHYGYLHCGTAPILARSMATFGCLEELGVGFHDDVEAFELFCEALPHSATLEKLDVQLFMLHDAPTVSCFLRALAVALPKLPKLGSITTIYTHSATPVLKEVPLEFLAALEAHQHLVDFTHRIRFGKNKLVEYYLLRNRYRDRLAAAKPIMVEAFHALDDANPLSCTLVKDTLCSRDDWFRKGYDQGRPMPPRAEPAPVIRRFQKGLLF